MNTTARDGANETAYLVRTFHEMTRLAQEVSSMLPGFDRQMRVVGDTAAAAQLFKAYKEFKAVVNELDGTWAQLEPTLAGVLEARPEISPPV